LDRAVVQPAFAWLKAACRTHRRRNPRLPKAALVQVWALVSAGPELESARVVTVLVPLEAGLTVRLA
jgi:hypothetical protein